MTELLEMDSVTNQSRNYSIIKEDSEKLLKLVDKYVQIHTIKNCCYIGFVHSFDPVTYSAILAVPQEETYQIILIPGHTILDVTEEQLTENIKPPQRRQTVINSEDVLKRKEKLIAWFKSNLLPVSELDDKIVIGNVNLLPPYNTLDLCTENPIVALQIQKIMERMPKDFSP